MDDILRELQEQQQQQTQQELSSTRRTGSGGDRHSHYREQHRSGGGGSYVDPGDEDSTTNIFVGNLAPSITEEQMTDLFRQFGENMSYIDTHGTKCIGKQSIRCRLLMFV
jgi:RNA recognition motif-containing protein